MLRFLFYILPLALFLDLFFAQDQNIVPGTNLPLVSELEYTTLKHPLFPQYGIRIKKTKFCDTTVNAYTGYIDVQARHLFFYFFESRNNPDQDDIVMWFNGGPGCSSSMGLFMELGPCRVLNSSGPVFHAESWNTNANIFFIDQPVGVGFSYADFGETVNTSAEAAKDIAAFVSIFFEHFAQFKGRRFHLAGESYAGRFLPVFASVIYDQNARLVNVGLEPINLASLMLGNGLTDSLTMTLARYDIMCTKTSLDPILDIGACVSLKNTMQRCKRWIKESCMDIFDGVNCEAAVLFCQGATGAAFSATNKNPYDLSQECQGDPFENLCYPALQHVWNYLSKPSTRLLLGVDPSLLATFSNCNRNITSAFHSTLDPWHPSTSHVAALLERGIRVLVYVGENDAVCNWIGNERWTEALEWSGGDEFRRRRLREWRVGEDVVGMVRRAGNLTFATIRGAGHMAPYDKPKEALVMLQRWLAGEEL